MDTYDLVVIGAGPAGQAAAELAAHVGRRAIVVEQHRPGGVVTTTGGAPTKTLREAARYLTGFGQAEVYGVRPSIPQDVALPIVVARTQEVRDRLQSIVARRLAGLGIGYLQGAARPMAASESCTAGRFWWRRARGRPTRRASRSTIRTSSTPTASSR